MRNENQVMEISDTFVANWKYQNLMNFKRRGVWYRDELTGAYTNRRSMDDLMEHFPIPKDANSHHINRLIDKEMVVNSWEELVRFCGDFPPSVITESIPFVQKSFGTESIRAVNKRIVTWLQIMDYYGWFWLMITASKLQSGELNSDKESWWRHLSSVPLPNHYMRQNLVTDEFTKLVNISQLALATLGLNTHRLELKTYQTVWERRIKILRMLPEAHALMLAHTYDNKAYPKSYKPRKSFLYLLELVFETVAPKVSDVDTYVSKVDTFIEYVPLCKI